MKEVISSIIVDLEGGHAHIHVWNRGGKAGVLVVLRDDYQEIVKRLVEGSEVHLVVRSADLAPETGETKEYDREVAT